MNVALLVEIAECVDELLEYIFDGIDWHLVIDFEVFAKGATLAVFSDDVVVALVNEDLEYFDDMGVI